MILFSLWLTLLPGVIDTYLSNLQENYILRWFPFELKRIVIVTLTHVDCRVVCQQKELLENEELREKR